MISSVSSLDALVSAMWQKQHESIIPVKRVLGFKSPQMHPVILSRMPLSHPLGTPSLIDSSVFHPSITLSGTQFGINNKDLCTMNIWWEQLYIDNIASLFNYSSGLILLVLVSGVQPRGWTLRYFTKYPLPPPIFPVPAWHHVTFNGKNALDQDIVFCF